MEEKEEENDDDRPLVIWVSRATTDSSILRGFRIPTAG